MYKALMHIFSESLFCPPWYHIFIVLFLLSFSISLIMKTRRERAHLPPSPPSLPIIGNLHQLGNLPHRSLWKLSAKYGPVMLLRLGKIPTLIVSSPETAKEVLKTNDLDCCSRPYSHGAMKLTYNLVDVAFGPYSDYWREIRKLFVQELLSAKRVQSFHYIREQEVASLVNELSKVSTNPVMLNEKIFDLTNNIICKIAFGKSYEGKQFQKYKFDQAIEEAMAMLSGFWATDFFPYFGRIIDGFKGLHRRLEKCFSDYDAFFEKIIEEHLSDPETTKAERENIIDILLGLSEDETAPVRLSRNHIKSILFDLFIGATDTSALTMVWAMTELARNPRVMRKVQAEIRSIIGKKSKVDGHEIEKLKYLKMVVKETLRLHPPVTLLIPRETMRHCKIGGYDVYPKTRILVNAWALGRHPGTWKNPDEFHPERFEDSDVDFQGQHFELVPFGAGRRICPGLTMGTTSVEFTLANLLHCFDWEMPAGMKSEDISMEEEAGLTVHKKVPLCLVPIKYKWQE